MTDANTIVMDFTTDELFLVSILLTHYLGYVDIEKDEQYSGWVNSTKAAATGTTLIDRIKGTVAAYCVKGMN